MKSLLLSVKKKKELEEFFHLFQGFNEDIKKIIQWRNLLKHPYDFSFTSFSHFRKVFSISSLKIVCSKPSERTTSQ